MQGTLCCWFCNPAPSTITFKGHPAVKAQQFGSLLAASFSSDKTCLLLTFETEWMVLSSSCWAVESHILCRGSLVSENDPAKACNPSFKIDQGARPAELGTDTLEQPRQSNSNLQTDSALSTLQPAFPEARQATSTTRRVGNRLFGSLFLNFQPTGLEMDKEGMRILVWDSGSNGEVFGISSAGRCTKILSLQLETHGLLAAFAMDSTGIFLCSSEGFFQQSVLWRPDLSSQLQQSGTSSKSTAPSEEVAENSNGGRHHQQVSSQQDRVQHVTVSLVALPGSCAPFTIFRVKICTMCIQKCVSPYLAYSLITALPFAMCIH